MIFADIDLLTSIYCGSGFSSVDGAVKNDVPLVFVDFAVPKPKRKSSVRFEPSTLCRGVVRTNHSATETIFRPKPDSNVFQALIA